MTIKNHTFPAKVTDFCNKFRDSRPSFSAIEDKQAKWIYEESDIPWIHLDIEIPFEEMFKEAQVWVEDMIPQNYPALFDKDRKDLKSKEGTIDQDAEQVGWNTICIHGLGKHKFDRCSAYGYEHEDEVPYDWTEVGQASPVTKKFLESLPYEKLYRARFTALMPGGYAAPHIGRKENADYSHKMNFSLNHPEGFEFILKDAGKMPWKVGQGYLINASEYYHCVLNNSSEVRIHLITMGKPDWKKLAKLVEKKYYSKDPFGYLA